MSRNGNLINIQSNDIENNKEIYCFESKKKIKVIKTKKCIYENCIIQPSFNKKGEKSGLYCLKHKDDDMINVTCVICNYENCIKRATCNFKGKTKLLYCSEHKEKGMIIISKVCIYDDCETTSCYNFDGETKPLYCKSHKKEDMVNVKNKILCIYEGCKKMPYFNIEGKKGLYCFDHKKDDMINVKSKKCIYEGCKKTPSFNKDGEKGGLYCFEHKNDDMINIISNICIYKNCNIRASYNFEGLKKSLYCSSHKLDNMIDVTHEKCKTYLCYTLAKEKYEGYCLYCYINIFPDKHITRNYKTKESAVIQYIKNNFAEYDLISDKIIKDGCSKRRPDLLLDLGYQVIIIEIDENKHIDYDRTCENKRMMELSKDLNHRPIIFIRFNPDDYLIQDKKITSCWSINKKGICIVKKSKNCEWNKRLEALKEQIIYWLNPENKINKTIEIIKLFYNM